MKKAVAYCSVATNRADIKNSLENQRNLIEQYARANNIIINKFYVDVTTGLDLNKRLELLKLLEDSKKQDFNIVLVRDIARVSRTFGDIKTIYKILKTNKKDVFFIGEGKFLTELLQEKFDSKFIDESKLMSKTVKLGIKKL